jgi:Protein of unknown function (DUF3866)
MPLSLSRGRVSAVLERIDELVRLEVDGVPCVAYPRLTGPVEEGDEVLVNVQARELGLGSGGFDVLYANLTRGLGLGAAEHAHVMTLPYTPVQTAVRHVEEDGPLAESLDGMPVVCCTLHSQLMPVCAGIGDGVSTAYVQVGGGALPVSLSDAVRALKRRGLVEVAVAASPCVDGDVQAVTVASALAWAAARGLQIAVCSIGPGIVGTASALGHGGISAADAANAAIALGGRPVLAVRGSGADSRARHRGVSHHVDAVRSLCLGDVATPGPGDVDTRDWREACAGLSLSHMGRGPDEDPSFFELAFAAGRYARELLAGHGSTRLDRG